MDNFCKKFIDAIKSSKTDDDLSMVINKVYEAGFEDGTNEAS